MTLQRWIIRSIKAALAAAALAMTGTGVSVAQVAPAVTITASPAVGVSPLQTTIAWNAVGVTSCTKSGAWSGTAALTGSQVVTVNSGSSVFTLTCVGTIEPVTVSWTPPTTNTDGSALTNLSHYDIFHAATPGAVSSANGQATRVNAPAASYVFTSLPAGPRCFGMTANNTDGIASQLSAIACASRDIAQASASGTVTVVARPRPGAPTAVTVQP